MRRRDWSRSAVLLVLAAVAALVTTTLCALVVTGNMRRPSAASSSDAASVAGGGLWVDPSPPEDGRTGATEGAPELGRGDLSEGYDLAGSAVPTWLGTDAATVSMRSSPEPLVEEATDVLMAYRDQGSCVLARSGYLDLLGRVWSCTVMGGGWVEVQVLSERDGGTDVAVVRMEARDWESDMPDADATGEGE